MAAERVQRRQVTVLFADMVGYTPLAENLGEEKTYLLMQRVHRELSEAVHAHDGTVQELTGDGVMALFGAPVALEDAPLRACRAACDIQARMAAVGDEIETEHGARPAFRVGLHSGPLIIGAVGDEQKMEITALGDTVNLASRLESEADTGGILMSEATHALVEGYVDSEFAGERAIKGKAEPQKLWRLNGVREGVSRFDVSLGRGLTPLIGRRREIESLESRWREASAGAVRAANIVGEAGIGKSRLAYEFRARLDDGKTFFLDGHCTAEGRTTPFLPFIEVVRTSFRIPDEADAPEAERRLVRGLEVLGLAAEEILPYLMNLLGLAPADSGLDTIGGEVLGIRTRDAIVAMLGERCRLTPTALFIEDLHWIDSASENLLARAAEDSDGLPLLIVSTYRSEYRPPWAGQANVTELRLTPLSGGSTVELLQERLGATELPKALTRMVVEKSEGNPLFAEEIANYLVDAGSLRMGGDGVSYDSRAGKAVLPVTLENLLMDRFDRLAEGPREALEAASVIGPRFSVDLVAAASEDGGAAGHLAELERLELIRREPERSDYRFKHALVQDAIYDGLLTARREALHERVAETLEAGHTDYPDEVADVLAYHWARTGRADKAVKFLALAGENSLRVYSLEEAEQRFRQALELIDAHPGVAQEEVRTGILLHLARILYFQCNFFRIIELVEKYLPRVEALGDRKLLSRFLFEGGYAHVFAAQIEPGRELLDRARALGEETGDDVAVAYADLGLMWDRMFWGEPGEQRRRTQRDVGERIVETGKRHGDIWLASKALLCLGLDGTGWGRSGEARADLLRLLALSRETNDPRPRSMGLWAMAALHLYEGEFGEAVESADESLRVCLSPIDRFAARSYRDAAIVLMGRIDEAFQRARRDIQTAQEHGLIFNMAVPTMVIGVGTVLRGEMALGVRTIEDAVTRFTALGQEIIRATGDSFLGQVYLQMAIGGEKPPLSVMLRNIGFLLRTLPAAEKKARRCFESAAALHRSFDMPFPLAQNLYSLGLLDKAKKRSVEARTRFEEARAIAASVEATALVDQVDAAMADLPTF